MATGALKEIAEAKILVPTMALTVIDRAVQAFGGAGVCQDTPLASLWANGRTMRIVDGPDEVHLMQLGRNENKRGPDLKEKIERQQAKSKDLARKMGIERMDNLYLGRVSGEKSKL